MRDIFSFSSDIFGKRVFSFIDDDRMSLKKAEVGTETSIRVKCERGETSIISFRVTRNAHLSSAARWIYGKVLNTPDIVGYCQIEIKLYDGEPEMDTIEVFLQAPPL